jgi:rSAM/selenodomain-associated transferase 1
MSAERPVALLFAKQPVAGRVKTRLARDIGDVAALEAYETLAKQAWRTLGESGLARWVVFDPPDAGEAMARWLPAADRYWPQVAGDLGARLTAAIEAALASGAPAVIALGTDAPGMTAAHLREAVHELGRDEMALGPAEDGGYWGLALARPEPRLFEGIAWSTDVVAAQTLAAARSLGMRVRRLPILSDIDTVHDYRRWIG